MIHDRNHKKKNHPKIQANPSPVTRILSRPNTAWLVVFSHPSEKYAQVKMGSSSPIFGVKIRYIHP